VHPRIRLAGPALAALLAVAALPPAAAAQSLWLDRANPKTIHLELAKPLFDGDEGFLTFAGFLSARLPVGDRLAFVGELPMANLAVDDETSTTIGNPYLGIETRPDGGHGGRFELGLRPPLASEDELAFLAGLGADLPRWEAFIPEAFFARAAAHWRSDMRDGAPGFDLGVAPVVWFPQEDGDTELFVTYSAQVLVDAAQVRGGVGLSGRWWATAEDADFGEASTHQLGVALDFLRGGVRPGLVLRVPLEEAGIILNSPDAVIGVTLNFVLD
jgi:hypothetical protein